MEAPWHRSPAPISDDVLHWADRLRSPDDLQRLSDFNRRIYLPLVLSAILPIVVAASRSAEDSRVSIIVNVVAWLVFILDLAVHTRLIRGYLRTKVGMFDLAVVVLTAPWFLIPGLEGSQLFMLARLARLARLLFVSKAARRAAQRLGKVGLFAAGMLLFCSWMAYVGDHPTNPEFATFGDALWWGVVTLTTVGYGDIVPETEQGRMAGVFLMLTGIATLGIISGTLASVFRLTPAGTTESETPAPPAAAPVAAAPPLPASEADAEVAAQLAAVRAQLLALEQRLAGTSPAGTSQPSSPPTDPAA